MAYEGIDRRGPNRRGVPQNNEGYEPSYFEEMILGHLQNEQKNKTDQETKIRLDMLEANRSKDFIDGKMSVKSLGPLIVAMITSMAFLVGVWVNLNSAIDTNKQIAEKDNTELKHSYEMNKLQMEKLSSDAEKTIGKLEVKLDMIEKRIGELDNSVSQMYQRIQTNDDKKIK